MAGEVVVDTLAVRSRDVGAAPATIEDGDPGPGRLHVGGTDLGLGIDLAVDELVGRLGVRVGVRIGPGIGTPENIGPRVS